MAWPITRAEGRAGQGRARQNHERAINLIVCVMPWHNGHYADFESVIENFIEKLCPSFSLSLCLSLYAYLCMSISFSFQVGNCVGKRNYRFFYLFLVSLAFLAVFIFSCSVTHLVLCK